MKKYAIIVAGYEYHSGGTNYNIFADRRKNKLLSLHPEWVNDSEAIIVRFDVRNGRIEQNVFRNGRRDWILERDNFDSINRRVHYTRTNHSFIQQETNVIGMNDVYEYVQNIGRNDPGSLHELSVIGHGFIYGPIIVNSYEREEFKGNNGNKRFERDPWDKDARPKDFMGENMNKDNWMNFRNAFHENGYAWIWGCVFSRASYNTLYKLMRTPEWRRKRWGEHVDSDEFTLRVNRNFAKKYYKFDSTFFPSSENELTFTRSLFQIKKFLTRSLRYSYAGRFCVDTGITCFAGFVGTYSDYERPARVRQPRQSLMVVPRSRRLYGTDFTKTINFYKTYLNLEEDPENKGYCKYNFTQALEWWDTN